MSDKLAENLNGFLGDYLDHIRSEHRMAPNTIEAYNSDIQTFIGFISGKDEELYELDANIIREYCKWLGSSRRNPKPGGKPARKLSPTTLERRLVGLRNFLRFLFERGMISERLAGSIDLPRKPSHLPDFLTEDDIAALLEAVATSGFAGARNLAVIEILYASGCRVSELTGMDIDDIDLDVGSARVVGKGSKERIVIIGEFAISAVRNYLPERMKLARENESALFIGKSGKRLSVRTIQRLVRKASELADIPGGISPHGIRHSFATHLLAGGADLRTIQELLGHASLSTVQKYTHLDTEHLRQIHSDAHPLGDSSEKA